MVRLNILLTKRGPVRPVTGIGYTRLLASCVSKVRIGNSSPKCNVAVQVPFNGDDVSKLVGHEQLSLLKQHNQTLFRPEIKWVLSVKGALT